MIWSWSNLPPAQAPDLLYDFTYRWSPETVILEYDGPQMMTTRRDTGRHIALAVDESEDGEIVRWIEAPLSNLEYEALVRGATSVRTVFEKETIRIIDYTPELKPLRVFELDSLALPDGALPPAGVRLPESARSRLMLELNAKPQEEPLFTLEGSAPAGGGVLFKALGAGITRLQTLFDELSSSRQLGPIPLAATAFAPGSLKVSVHVPNPVAFDRAAQDYEALVRITDDAKRLAAVLDEHYSPAISTAYRAYLETLAEHKIQVLAQWRDRSCFVAYGSARRIGAPAEVVPELPEPEPNPEPLRVYGNFLDFWGTGRGTGFRFVELSTGKKFEGGVHRDVIERVSQERQQGTFSMLLGAAPVARYFAEIQVTEIPGKPDKYLLLTYQDVPPEPSGDLSAPIGLIRFRQT